MASLAFCLILGWSMDSSFLRDSGSEKISFRSAGLLSRLSAVTMPGPKALSISAKAGCPGSTISWAITSVSITGTPILANSSETRVLPEAIPPVNATVNGSFGVDFTNRSEAAQAAAPQICINNPVTPQHGYPAGQCDKRTKWHGLAGLVLFHANHCQAYHSTYQ